MLTPKDLEIISHLRQNSRKSLVDISNDTKVPTSTVFDKLKCFNDGVIKKYTAIVDFPLIGYNIRVFMMLKSSDEERLKCFLFSHGNVNSVFQINNGYAFFIDCIFRDSKEFFYFRQELDKLIVSKQVFNIIDEIKREDFLVERGVNNERS